jgi:hypothetical protein
MRLSRLILRSWIGRPVIDIPILAVVYVLLKSYLKQSILHSVGQPAFAATAAGVCAAAVGFSITAMTVLLSVTPGHRLKEVMNAAGDKLVRLIMFSVATLVALASLFGYCVLGQDASSTKLLILLTAGAFATLVELRIIGIFYQIFALLVIEHRGP